jgi:hypothetical protein
MKHPSAEKFISPLPIECGNSIGLKTVEQKLKNNEYSSSTTFAQDVRQVFDNSLKYCLDGTEAFNVVQEVSNFFASLMKDVGDVEFNVKKPNENQEQKKPSAKTTSGTKKTAQDPSSSSWDKPMSVTEKSLLRSNILKLPPDKISEMLPIIQSSIDLSNSTESVEFDIDTLPTRLCRELEHFVNSCLPKPKSSKVKKVETKKSSPTHKEVN